MRILLTTLLLLTSIAQAEVTQFYILADMPAEVDYFEQNIKASNTGPGKSYRYSPDGAEVLWKNSEYTFAEITEFADSGYDVMNHRDICLYISTDENWATTDNAEVM